MSNKDLATGPIGVQTGRQVEEWWNRVLMVAKSRVKETDPDPSSPVSNSEDTPRSSSNTNTSERSSFQISNTNRSDVHLYHTFRERESDMVESLEKLFTLAREGPGYLAFLATITGDFDPDSPVSMAFLSHVIDKVALPTRETIESISPIILNKINTKSSKVKRMLSLLAGRYKLEKNATKREAIRKQICDENATSSRPSLITCIQNIQQTNAKRNGAILWSFIAERFAGPMMTYIWSPEVGDMLIKSLADPQEDLSVRICSLIAIEKFSLTSTIKKKIMTSGYNMRQILFTIVKECEAANERIFVLSSSDSSISPSSNPLNFTKRKQITLNSVDGPLTPFSSLNCFESRFVPPQGPLREEWTKYAQLSMCAKWSLDHVFIDENKVTCQWDLSSYSVIMNPFDATGHIKLASNGIEVRNDRPHFESIRATACIKKGKWYYETLILTNGIIQIGWATSRCRLSPEDGAGVGDDRNGFAFDVFRSCVWADGTAIYPRHRLKHRCEIGDVIGSYLDLDNGACSYYINGQSIGLTIHFEHPGKKNGNAKNAQPKNPQPKKNVTQNTDTSVASNSSSSSGVTLSHGYRSLHSTSSPALYSAPSSKSPPMVKHKKVSKKVAKAYGLYPAISLTPSQHAIVNFGERPWMYTPPIKEKFRGMAEAGALDSNFKNKVTRWVNKRGINYKGRAYIPSNKEPPRPLFGADTVEEDDVVDSDSSSDIDDDDENICTICYGEPSGVTLLPCRHGGIGGNCAKVLSLCPMCRAKIAERVIE